MSHSRSEYSTTNEPTAKKEHKRPKKILVEMARAEDVVLPPRTQLHISVDELLHEDDLDHDETTCWRCAKELDTEYDIGSDGFCHYVGQESIYKCTSR